MCYKMIVILVLQFSASWRISGLLIVTFLAFRSTHLFYSNTVHFTVRYVFVEFLVNAVIFITAAIFFVVKINFGFPVAIYTPSHAQVAELVYFRHLLYVTMTGLALLFTYFNVLAVVKINVVGQVVNFYPLNLF